jgi:hypothetical protein
MFLGKRLQTSDQLVSDMFVRHIRTLGQVDVHGLMCLGWEDRSMWARSEADA